MKKKKKHDEMLKAVLKYENNAKDFLKISLPKRILNSINFNSLKLQLSEFQSNRLQTFMADLVFNVSLKEDENEKVKLCILFEHKSYNEKTYLLCF